MRMVPQKTTAEAPLIAHVIHRLDYGGMETVLVDLINGMGDAPYRHAVICLTDYSAFRQRIRSPATEVFALGKREGKDMRVYWRLWKQLRRLRPALVNTYNLATLDAAPIARLAGCRVVHAEHGWTAERKAVPAKYVRLRRLMRPFVDRFVAVSRDLRDWLGETVGVAPGKLVCIHNGIATEDYQADERTRFSARQRAGIPPDAFVVGTVARLDPVKGQNWLIKAFARLDSELGRESRLLIVGDGPERARLEALIGDLGLGSRVQLTGTRDDVPELLAAFDLFALPSRNEGVSIAILEAMANGLPVVATRVGGNPEVVRDGETGQLVAVGDVAALSAAFARYRDDPELRRRHGEAGRLLQQAEFSRAGMVERYRRLYDEVLTGEPAMDERRGAA